MTVPLRAALYLRVSTARQAEHDVSIPDVRETFRLSVASRSTSIVGRIFVLQSRRSARCRAAPWAVYKLHDDGVVPLICPTCQTFSQARSKHPCWRQQATLHGLVFDILARVGRVHFNPPSRTGAAG